MKIEIITTGDEIMQGIIADTNTAWISGRCSSLGCIVTRHSSVGDVGADIEEVLKTASTRADAVIVTGGLGPTSDDITIQCAAKAFDRKLMRDDAVLEKIRERFTRLGRRMSPANEKQALIPEGGRVLQNDVGTAPGVLLTVGSCDFYFLPGVPKELYRIFDDSVMPRLAEKSSGFFSERVLRCFGLPESDIEERLSGLDLSGVRLSFRVKFPEILLKLVARSDDAGDAEKHVGAAAARIHEKLGAFVYGEGDEELPAVTGRILASRGMRIAVAESCTGGLISSRITDAAGSSEYFDRGAVVYSNTAKMEMLGVTEETLKGHGAVSAETAMSMAEGARRIASTELAVSATGIAGPAGGSPEKPVGLVFIALAAADGTWVFKYNFSRDRVWFKSVVAETAIDLVRRYLLGCLPEDKGVR